MTELAELPVELFVYRLSSLASVPFDSLVALGQSTFWNLSATPDEVSLVAPQLAVDNDVPVVGPLTAFRVVGNLDFALTGMLASLTQPLALAQISVFSVSTYNTDYLLVKTPTRVAAIAAWHSSGVEVVSAEAD